MQPLRPHIPNVASPWGTLSFKVPWGSGQPEVLMSCLKEETTKSSWENDVKMKIV